VRGMVWTALLLFGGYARWGGGVQVGWKCVKLDGSMSMEARDRMINTFSHDPDCKVRSPSPSPRVLTYKKNGQQT